MLGGLFKSRIVILVALIAGVIIMAKFLKMRMFEGGVDESKETLDISRAMMTKETETKKPVETDPPHTPAAAPVALVPEAVKL